MRALVIFRAHRVAKGRLNPYNLPSSLLANPMRSHAGLRSTLIFNNKQPIGVGTWGVRCGVAAGGFGVGWLIWG